MGYHPAATTPEIMPEPRKCLALTTNEFMIEVIPYIDNRYWFYAIYDLKKGALDYSKRPVRADYLLEGIEHLLPAETDLSALTWKTDPHEPCVRCPFEPDPRWKSDKNGFVYFLQSANGGPIRIGFAADSPEERRNQIQNMCPYPLIVLASIKGLPQMERGLHKRFAHLHSHGEWFYPDHELSTFIEEVVRHE